jgi:MFS family permease
MSEAPDLRNASIMTGMRRRNYLIYAAEGSFFIASGAFINAQTVMPALVVELGGDTVTVGILSVFVYFGVFIPQLFSARIVETIVWKKRWILAAGLAHRMLALGMGVAVLLFGGRHPALTLWLMIGFYASMQMGIGFATPGWYDMLAKLIDSSARGKLFGIRASIGSGGAFLCGLLLTWFLHAFPFPYNYGIGMVLAFIFQMASFFSQVWLVEDVPSQPIPRRSLPAYFSEMAPIIRNDHAFRRFLVGCALLTVAAMPVGFYAVYALSEFHVSISIIGEFTVIIVVSQMVSALVSGYMVDRFGNKRGIIIGATALLLASATATVAPSLAVFRLVFVFLGIHLGTEMYARYNIALELSAPHRSSTYIGLMNTLVAPFYLSGLLGGLLSAWIGFRGIFIIALLFSISGILFFVGKITDPRRHTGR